MTKRKTTLITSCIYLFCALVWAVNFAINWHGDGAITVSTGLYGVAAACFAVAAVLGFVRYRRMPKEDE